MVRRFKTLGGPMGILLVFVVEIWSSQGKMSWTSYPPSGVSVCSWRNSTMIRVRPAQRNQDSVCERRFDFRWVCLPSNLITGVHTNTTQYWPILITVFHIEICRVNTPATILTYFIIQTAPYCKCQIQIRTIGSFGVSQRYTLGLDWQVCWKNWRKRWETSTVSQQMFVRWRSWFFRFLNCDCQRFPIIWRPVTHWAFKSFMPKTKRTFWGEEQDGSAGNAPELFRQSFSLPHVIFLLAEKHWRIIKQLYIYKIYIHTFLFQFN